MAKKILVKKGDLPIVPTTRKTPINSTVLSLIAIVIVIIVVLAVLAYSFIPSNPDDGGPPSSDELIDGINKKPVANAGFDQTVNINENVAVDGSKSSDSDGNISKYEWDFNEDGIYDWESSITGSTTHTYNGGGVFNAKLRVTDNDGTTATDSCQITVQLTESDFKKSCLTNITYDELDSNPDSYIDIHVTYKGKIIQVINGIGETSYRLDVDNNDIVYVTISNNPSLIVNDIVQIWGEVIGDYTYTSTASWTITLPHIRALYIEKISFLFNIGQSAQWINHNVTVKAVELTDSYTWTGSSGTQYVEYATSGKIFVILDVMVEYIGTSSDHIYAGDFWLIDSDNFKYDYDSATYSIDGGLEGTTLYTNQKVQGKILYEISNNLLGLFAQFDFGSYSTPIIAQWSIPIP